MQGDADTSDATMTAPTTLALTTTLTMVASSSASRCNSSKYSSAAIKTIRFVTTPMRAAMETSYCERCGEFRLHILASKDPAVCKTLELCNRCAAMEILYCASCGEVLLPILVLKDPTDCETLERCHHCSSCSTLSRARRCDTCGAKPTDTLDLYQVMHPQSMRLLGFCETCLDADGFCRDSAISQALGLCAVCGEAPRTELITLVNRRTMVRKKHCFRCATSNTTEFLAKQLQLSIGILFRDAVPEFSNWIAEFLHEKVWVKPARTQKAFARHVELVRAGTPEQKNWGADALRRLARGDAENLLAIAAAGGNEALLALAREGTRQQRQSSLCALRGLACNAENRIAIAAAGGVEVFAALARAEILKTEALLALWNLGCGDAENQTAVAAAGAFTRTSRLRQSVALSCS